MPLTYDEYGHLEDFSVLYSGGLDSIAVALYLGLKCQGKAHLLTYMHQYGALFNEWSRKHNQDLARVLGEDGFEHHLIDLTTVWDEVGFKKVMRDAIKYKGHWVLCLGCQQSMAAHTIVYSLERNISNAFICSSVGGEYAVMSMSVTREKNIENYARYGIRYNAPLLDMGINKNEERRIVREHDVEPGWGKRRSHQGYQPICLLGFQHALDIVVDFHTTYPPDRVGAFLDEKFEVMDSIIRRILIERGHDPDELIARNLAKYQREQARLDASRAQQAG
ncbi:MAG: hypothetical protein H6742_08160 [Alphaproteobacteria bacterium]|nr:hypothetical protein [Alphaproteobacteria bacterium]